MGSSLVTVMLTCVAWSLWQSKVGKAAVGGHWHSARCLKLSESLLQLLPWLRKQVLNFTPSCTEGPHCMPGCLVASGERQRNAASGKSLVLRPDSLLQSPKWWEKQTTWWGISSWGQGWGLAWCWMSVLKTEGFSHESWNDKNAPKAKCSYKKKCCLTKGISSPNKRSSDCWFLGSDLDKG